MEEIRWPRCTCLDGIQEVRTPCKSQVAQERESLRGETIEPGSAMLSSNASCLQGGTVDGLEGFGRLAIDVVRVAANKTIDKV